MQILPLSLVVLYEKRSNLEFHHRYGIFVLKFQIIQNELCVRSHERVKGLAEPVGALLRPY